MTPLPFRTAVPAVAPRDAASVLVLRDGDAGLQVLMVRRSPTASFMPGAYVFPGGAVDADDGTDEARGACDGAAAAALDRLGTQAGVGDRAQAFAVAALRECLEECGLWIGPDATPAAALAALRARLHGGEPLPALARAAGLPLQVSALQPWARWVTPVGVPRRFDTLFFLATAPAGQQPSVDAGETTTLAWVHPPEALGEQAAGRFPMEFATVALLRSLLPLSGLPVPQALARAAAAPPLCAVHPRLKLEGDGRIVGVLMPGEPGYAQAPGDG